MVGPCHFGLHKRCTISCLCQIWYNFSLTSIKFRNEPQMDRPVQIVLLLAAIFSLRLNNFFLKNDIAKPGISQPANYTSILAGDDVISCADNSIFFSNSTFLAEPGLQIIDFQLNRTTFGFVDAGYTQPFDPTQANKKVALGCDSIAMNLVAVVNGITVSDSLGFQVRYGNPDGSTTSNQLFLFDAGTVRITNGGSIFNCNVPLTATSVSSVLGQKTLKINLHNCLTGLGLTLQNGDTISFSGKFLVNANGPLTPQFVAVPGLDAFGYAQQNGNLLACDTLAETFTLAKSEVVFDFPNTLNGLPIGCENGTLNWRLFVPNNDFSDWFGNELRAATKVDSLVFDFDPGLLSAFTGGQIEVSIPGHPIHGDNYFPIRPLSDFPNGHYVANFDTLQRVPSLNQVQTYTFDLRLNLKPTCESPTGSQAGDNVYEIASEISYTDRYYANLIGNGSCVNQQSVQATSAVAYNQSPTFTLTPITPAAAPLTNGIASWDIRICNTSTQSDAGLTWLALEDPSGLLNIGVIANITNPGNPIPLALTPFGQNYFAFIPAIQAGQCLTYRIAATTSTCDDVALNIRTGWNCSAFPANWNPDDNAPCSSDFLPLTLVNTGVSPIQINFTASTSACNGTSESVVIQGNLASATNLPTDNYTLSFVFDENGDGIVQTTEPVLAQQTTAGPITPANPLIFNQLMQLQPDTACHLLLKVESLLNNICSSLSTVVPLPSFQNAGLDRTFCGISGQYSTTIGSVACDTSGYRLAWTAIAPATNNMLSDTSHHAPTVSFDPTIFSGQTISFVISTERLGCAAISYDTVSIIVPQDAQGVFEQAELILQVPDCQTNAQVCAEISSLLVSDFIFIDNGQPYSGNLPVCTGGFALQLAPGYHELIATDTVSSCSDTISVSVNCTATDTIQVNLLLGEMDTICLRSNELSGVIEMISNACTDGQFVDFQYINDSCAVFTGNLVGQETACLVVCDANGFCDTTILEITVSHPFPNGILDTITLTQSQQYCFDAQQLNLEGVITEIQNLCPVSSGNSVAFSLDSTGFCVDYIGLSVGSETACIELCDNLGNCDTINLTVSVVPGIVFFDTVFLLLETDTFCLPNGLLPSPVVSVEDICPENNGNNVNFTVNGSCIHYSGFAIGTDIACYRFEDASGNVALIEMQVSVRKTTPNSFCDTLFVGEKTLHCLDVSELPGSFAEGSMNEICPDERTGNIEMLINEAGACIFYEGITVGRDSSCIIYCDEFGFCDTSYFCFLVKPYFDSPDLGPDVDTTLKGTPVVIDFLANDTIFGGIEDIYILEEPVGEVVLNLDNSFTYIPENNSCDWTDVFTYVACNPNGCDTTTVSIYIQCIELTIFTAISPNNDDVNDVFYIAKIEEFPENHLWVYNIWGNLVYETKTYRNNWPGTWGSDTDLPDGTYYYVLEWSDNGTTTVQQGYMELFR